MDRPSPGDELPGAPAQMRRFFDRIPVGLYVSTPDGRFLNANPAFLRIVHAEDLDALQRVGSADLYVDPEDRRAWQERIAVEGVVRDFVCRHRTLDGREIWLEETARAVEERGWAPDFYMVCMYHIDGYKGKLGIEQDEKFKHEDRKKALEAIGKLPKPCFAYKILAAGRIAPREAFREVFSAVKPSDGVTVGMFPPDGSTGDIVAENAALVEEFAGSAGK